MSSWLDIVHLEREAERGRCDDSDWMICPDCDGQGCRTCAWLGEIPQSVWAEMWRDR